MEGYFLQVPGKLEFPQRVAVKWTLPHLIDRKISMDYKEEGAEDGQKGHRTAKLLKRV
jgi:hypothetical protein